jgi:hypothetical protein
VYVGVWVLVGVGVGKLVADRVLERGLKVSKGVLLVVGLILIPSVGEAVALGEGLRYWVSEAVKDPVAVEV